MCPPSSNWEIGQLEVNLSDSVDRRPEVFRLGRSQFTQLNLNFAPFKEKELVHKDSGRCYLTLDRLCQRDPSRKFR